MRRICTVCGRLGCNHRKRAGSRGQGSASRQRWYQKKEWKRQSRAFRHLNPLCVECLGEGVETAAWCVDHVIPWDGDPRLFWDQDNWQSLCRRHHSRKTRDEQRQN